MRVSCPDCAAVYTVADEKIPAGGAQLRCPRCAKVFRVGREAAVAQEPDRVGPQGSFAFDDEATLVATDGELPGPLPESLGWESTPGARGADDDATAGARESELDRDAQAAPPWLTRSPHGVIRSFADLDALLQWARETPESSQYTISRDGQTWRSIGGLHLFRGLESAKAASVRVAKPPPPPLPSPGRSGDRPNLPNLDPLAGLRGGPADPPPADPGLAALIESAMASGAGAAPPEPLSLSAAGIGTNAGAPDERAAVAAAARRRVPTAVLPPELRDTRIATEAPAPGPRAHGDVDRMILEAGIQMVDDAESAAGGSTHTQAPDGPAAAGRGPRPARDASPEGDRARGGGDPRASGKGPLIDFDALMREAGIAGDSVAEGAAPLRPREGRTSTPGSPINADQGPEPRREEAGSRAGTEPSVASAAAPLGPRPQPMTGRATAPSPTSRPSAAAPSDRQPPSRARGTQPSPISPAPSLAVARPVSPSTRSGPATKNVPVGQPPARAATSSRRFGSAPSRAPGAKKGAPGRSGARIASQPGRARKVFFGLLLVAAVVGGVSLVLHYSGAVDLSSVLPLKPHTRPFAAEPAPVKVSRVPPGPARDVTRRARAVARDAAGTARRTAAAPPEKPSTPERGAAPRTPARTPRGP